MLYIKKILFLCVNIVIFFSYNPSFAEDTYDPFSDYSEFSIIKEEEQDVNFFNDGRFLSLGFLIKRAQPTGDLAEIYGGGTGVHIFASYFFDLRFALEVSYGSQNHKYVTADGSISSSSEFSDLGFAIKYYINPDRIVYSLSRFNPYLLAGLSLVTEERILPNTSSVTSKKHRVYNFGTGFELPLPGKKFFISGQAVYNFSSNFGQDIEFGFKSGGFISMAVILGINF